MTNKKKGGTMGLRETLSRKLYPVAGNLKTPVSTPRENDPTEEIPVVEMRKRLVDQIAGDADLGPHYVAGLITLPVWP